MQTEYQDHPFEECALKASEIIKKGGARVYQKFTCAGCGARLSMDEPNIFYTQGTCDKCEIITDILQNGCNYMLHLHAEIPPDKLTVCIIKA